MSDENEDNEASPFHYFFGPGPSRPKTPKSEWGRAAKDARTILNRLDTLLGVAANADRLAPAIYAECAAIALTAAAGFDKAHQLATAGIGRAEASEDRATKKARA